VFYVARHKVYVDVTAVHRADGTCRPSSIIFENGQTYEINRIKQRCRAASLKAGGTGIRYTVMIAGKETYLFDEENGKWFVEAKEKGEKNVTGDNIDERIC
jgi:hypothetical protein